MVIGLVIFTLGRSENQTHQVEQWRRQKRETNPATQLPILLIMLIAALIAFCSGSCDAASLRTPVFPPVPIVIHTPSECTTFTQQVVIRDGLVWVADAGGNDDATVTPAWSLLAGTGLPPPFNVSITASELSCDGNDLLVISDPDERLHLFRFSNESGHFTLGWQPNQGGMGLPFPQPLQVPSPAEGRTGLSVSQRGFENEYFTDAGGNEHPGAVGCDGIMVLMNNQTLNLMDNWSLPNLFLFRLPLPVRDRLIVRSFRASASTLFVQTNTGVMFTALMDFDIFGYDPLLIYSYNISLHGAAANSSLGLANPIVLPSSEWVRQPTIDAGGGIITDQITIVQTGVGNDARELRVAGSDASGASGYYSKSLLAGVWEFHPAQFSWDLLPHAIDNSGALEPVLVPEKEQNFTQAIVIPITVSGRQQGEVQVQLTNFQPGCSPATLTFNISSSTDSTARQFSLPLHHRFSWPASGTSKTSGIVVSGDWLQGTASDPLLAAALEALFGSQVSAQQPVQLIQLTFVPAVGMHSQVDEQCQRVQDVCARDAREEVESLFSDSFAADSRTALQLSACCSGVSDVSAVSSVHLTSWPNKDVDWTFRQTADDWDSVA